MEQKIEELQRKLQSLEKEKNEELKKLKQENDKIKQEYNQFRKEQSLSNSTQQNKHSTQFWDDINVKVMKDPDYVKSLIRNKTINQNDVNQNGQTLLHIAARFGSYGIVQFCLNGGADTNHKDNKGRTALDLCRKSGYYHIEQLLLFNEMNVNAGNKVKNTSDIINKQKGINENILQELSEIGEQTRDIFCKSMVELMINIISKKLAFSDTLLNLSWDIVCQNNKSNPLSSALWEILCSTCTNIINNGSKRDWYWFKTFVLPSTIWYKTVNIDNKMDEKEEKYEVKHKVQQIH